MRKQLSVILGLCSGGEGDLLPAVDVETLGKIADAAERAWKNEQLTSSRNFEYALTDLIIPEPFEDRKIGEGKEYTSAYTGWLDRCSSRFASEGLTVSKDGKQSSDSADIREAMEQVITPYLCSVRNVSLKSSEDKNGFITLSFDSLDVVGTLSSAKKPSVAALNKLCGVYSDERALKVTVNIDIVDLLDSGDSMSLPFFNIIRAITRYGSPSALLSPRSRYRSPPRSLRENPTVSGLSNSSGTRATEILFLTSYRSPIRVRKCRFSRYFSLTEGKSRYASNRAGTV